MKAAISNEQTRQVGKPSRGLSPALRRNLVIDAVLPWIAVQILQQAWHVPIVPAFAIASLFPAASIALSWLRHRRPDFIGIAVLVTIMGGITIALLTDDVRFAVLKAAPAFGLFGIACIASLGRERPLMFFVSRQLSAGDDDAEAAAWTARLKNAGFRRAMWLLTIVWGLACLLEAVFGVVAAFLLPPAVALVVEPVLGIGTVAGLLTWTLAYARRRSAQTANAEVSQTAAA
jgi:hypothetical protein